MICKYNGGWNYKKKNSFPKTIQNKINCNKKNDNQS
jgi:hypothetical protein